MIASTGNQRLNRGNRSGDGIGAGVRVGDSKCTVWFYILHGFRLASMESTPIRGQPAMIRVARIASKAPAGYTVR
ncbi:MAG TPA: hypothetical protein VFE75_00340, partial [Rhodanobacter sp.]|nr:hypothetical protein [Rhodanobacter sp.]